MWRDDPFFITEKAIGDSVPMHEKVHGKTYRAVNLVCRVAEKPTGYHDSHIFLVVTGQR
jgi:hypothetical protein